MELRALPFFATIAEYAGQAKELLGSHAAGEAWAIRLLHRKHPRFLDPKITWLPRNVADGEIEESALDEADAQLALARWYDFRDWTALESFAAAVAGDSAVRRFEQAADAVVAGADDELRRLLAEDPGLTGARSLRVTPFDPPVHRSTLLHYIAANGVEEIRQRTPANAVEMARILLQAGAEPDALASMYGGECTTLSLLVSSSHPAHAGLQIELTEALIDFGASLDDRGRGRWCSPLMTALVFGYAATAEALVRRGAAVSSVATAAGLGRVDEVRNLLAQATAPERHLAFALAAQLGHAEVVDILMDAGEDPDRYNPEGAHAHATPIHHAAIAGHLDVVRLLVERGARTDQRDRIYQSTPLGWAAYGRQAAVERFLQTC